MSDQRTRPQNSGWWDTGSRRFLATTHFLEPRAYGRPRRDPFQLAAEELLHGLALERGTHGKLVADLLRDTPDRNLYSHESIMPLLTALSKH